MLYTEIHRPRFFALSSTSFQQTFFYVFFIKQNVITIQRYNINMHRPRCTVEYRASWRTCVETCSGTLYDNRKHQQKAIEKQREIITCRLRSYICLALPPISIPHVNDIHTLSLTRRRLCFRPKQQSWQWKWVRKRAFFEGALKLRSGTNVNKQRVSCAAEDTRGNGVMTATPRALTNIFSIT